MAVRGQAAPASPAVELPGSEIVLAACSAPSRSVPPVAGTSSGCSATASHSSWHLERWEGAPLRSVPIIDADASDSGSEPPPPDAEAAFSSMETATASASEDAPLSTGRSTASCTTQQIIACRHGPLDREMPDEMVRLHSARKGRQCSTNCCIQRVRATLSPKP